MGLLARELQHSAQPVRHDGSTLTVGVGDLSLHLSHMVQPSSVRKRLEDEYVNMVLVDLRGGEGAPGFEVRSRDALELLDILDEVDDVEGRYGFHRIAVMVSDEDGAALDPLLLELGARGVRIVLRQTAGEADFARRALAFACDAIRGRRVEKTSLCLSGGGTTGIYFELGALKCLQDSLPRHALNDLDMYFGISAGAVVGSALAVGYSVDEIMASVAGVEGSRLPALDLELGRLANLNLRDAVTRWVRAASDAARALPRVLTGSTRASLDRLVEEYVDIWRPPFSARVLEAYLRDVYEAAGASNRFSDLDRELYIGASDLDARQHVLFGSDEAPDVDISEAVQASVSFNPVFAPVRLRGRDYEDGAVTRTSNFVEAIRRGATLLLVVDPFLPLVSREPGEHIKRGVFYQMDQTIRTMSFTRFDNARNGVLRRHPDVSMYTFVPSNRQRSLLTGRPMDHRIYAPIWRGAYLSTLARLERLEAKLSGDLEAHGMHLDLSRARAVAHRLEQIESPELADFWPDAEVELEQPPLTLQRQRRRLPPRLAG